MPHGRNRGPRARRAGGSSSTPGDAAMMVAGLRDMLQALTAPGANAFELVEWRDAVEALTPLLAEGLPLPGGPGALLSNLADVFAAGLRLVEEEEEACFFEPPLEPVMCLNQLCQCVSLGIKRCRATDPTRAAAVLSRLLPALGDACLQLSAVLERQQAAEKQAAQRGGGGGGGRGRGRGRRQQQQLPRAVMRAAVQACTMWHLHLSSNLLQMWMQCVEAVPGPLLQTAALAETVLPAATLGGTLLWFVDNTDRGGGGPDYGNIREELEIGAHHALQTAAELGDLISPGIGLLPEPAPAGQSRAERESLAELLSDDDVCALLAADLATGVQHLHQYLGGTAAPVADSDSSAAAGGPAAAAFLAFPSRERLGLRLLMQQRPQRRRTQPQQQQRARQPADEPRAVSAFHTRLLQAVGLSASFKLKQIEGGADTVPSMSRALSQMVTRPAGSAGGGRRGTSAAAASALSQQLEELTLQSRRSGNDAMPLPLRCAVLRGKCVALERVLRARSASLDPAEVVPSHLQAPLALTLLELLQLDPRPAHGAFVVHTLQAFIGQSYPPGGMGPVLQPLMCEVARAAAAQRGLVIRTAGLEDERTQLLDGLAGAMLAVMGTSAMPDLIAAFKAKPATSCAALEATLRTRAAVSRLPQHRASHPDLALDFSRTLQPSHEAHLAHRAVFWLYAAAQQSTSQVLVGASDAMVALAHSCLKFAALHAAVPGNSSLAYCCSALEVAAQAAVSGMTLCQLMVAAATARAAAAAAAPAGADATASGAGAASAGSSSSGAAATDTTAPTAATSLIAWLSVVGRSLFVAGSVLQRVAAASRAQVSQAAGQGSDTAGIKLTKNAAGLLDTFASAAKLLHMMAPGVRAAANRQQLSQAAGVVDTRLTAAAAQLGIDASSPVMAQLLTMLGGALQQQLPQLLGELRSVATLAETARMMVELGAGVCAALGCGGSACSNAACTSLDGASEALLLVAADGGGGHGSGAVRFCSSECQQQAAPAVAAAALTEAVSAEASAQ